MIGLFAIVLGLLLMFAPTWVAGLALVLGGFIGAALAK